MKSLPTAKRSQEEGFTQPSDHSFAQLCIVVVEVVDLSKQGSDEVKKGCGEDGMSLMTSPLIR